MNSAIYKYPFKVVPSFSLKMEAPAEILHVEAQGGTPCMWVRVYPHCGEFITRRFHLFGTGDHFNPVNLSHVATFQQPPFVWHVFEEQP